MRKTGIAWMLLGAVVAASGPPGGGTQQIREGRVGQSPDPERHHRLWQHPRRGPQDGVRRVRRGGRPAPSATAGRRGPARRSPASRYRWFPKRNARRRSSPDSSVVRRMPWSSVPRAAQVRAQPIVTACRIPDRVLPGAGQVTATAGPRRGPFDLPLVGERGPFSFRPERRTLHRVDGPVQARGLQADGGRRRRDRGKQSQGVTLTVLSIRRTGTGCSSDARSANPAPFFEAVSGLAVDLRGGHVVDRARGAQDGTDGATGFIDRRAGSGSSGSVPAVCSRIPCSWTRISGRC